MEKDGRGPDRFRSTIHRETRISIAEEGERLIDRRIYDISIKEFGKDREMCI